MFREIINRVSSLAPSLPVSSLPQESIPTLTTTEAHSRYSLKQSQVFNLENSRVPGQKRSADSLTSFEPLEKKASIEEMPLDLRKPSIKADTRVKNEVRKNSLDLI